MIMRGCCLGIVLTVVPFVCVGGFVSAPLHQQGRRVGAQQQQRLVARVNGRSSARPSPVTALGVKKRRRRVADAPQEEEQEDGNQVLVPGGDSLGAEGAELEATTVVASVDEAKDGEEAGPIRTKKYSFDLDIELPVESENKGFIPDGATGPSGPDGAFKLPDLKELSKISEQKKEVKQSRPEGPKVERNDIKSFTKLLELDPEADSDSALFSEEGYDYLSAALGEAKPFLGVPFSFLQSGHSVLALLLIFCASVDYPGFPLTELPYDIRTFIQRSLVVTYVINIGVAVGAWSKAKAVGQPPIFWSIKCFLLGGLAYSELSQIQPPVRKNTRSR
jgi:hypothetical protein